MHAFDELTLAEKQNALRVLRSRLIIYLYRKRLITTRLQKNAKFIFDRRSHFPTTGFHN